MAKKKRNKPKKKTVIRRSRYIEELYEDMRNGSVEATRELGRNYLSDELLPINYERAYSLLQQAYDQGDALAPALLATMYYKGQYVERDYDKAYALVLEGQRRGDPMAAEMMPIIDEIGDHPYAMHSIAELESAGAAGEDGAYEELAERYLLGIDVNANDDKAFFYFTKALHDEAEAAYRIGLNYANLKEESYRMSQAKKWLGQAIDGGHLQALCALGEVYLFDEQLNSLEGIEMLKQAAERDLPEALAMLGTIYQEGKVVPIDVQLSITYYERAMVLGETRMQPYLGLDYLMLADEKSVAHGLSLLEDAVTQGMDMAYFCLAYAYATGTGVAFDKGRAYGWVQKARENHVANVNQFYETIGAIINQNPDNLVLKFEKAYKQQMYDEAGSYATDLLDFGDGRAAIMMADYFKTSGDIEKQLRWLYDAAAVKEAKAYGILGDLYMSGDGVECDEAQAVKLYEEGAKYNDPHCLLKMSKAYQTGQGVPQDVEIAAVYQKKAYDLTFQREDS